MALNIPAYYYTDVYKRVPGESIASMQAKLANFKPPAIDNPATRLDISNSINLSTAEGRANNPANSAFDDLRPKVHNVDMSQIRNTPIEQEAVVMTNDGRPLDYYQFKNYIDAMGLTDDQKNTIANAIITSTESVQGQQQDSTTFGMRIAQTNLELKYVSEKLIPKEYQDHFNSMIDSYTDKLADRYTNFLETFETAFASSTDPVSVATGITASAKQALSELQNGTDTFHTSLKNYEALYNGIDITDDDKLKQGLSSVYGNFLNHDASYIKATGPVDQTALTNEVKYLSEKWNAVMDQIGGSDSLKFTTFLDCLA